MASVSSLRSTSCGGFGDLIPVINIINVFTGCASGFGSDGITNDKKDMWGMVGDKKREPILSSDGVEMASFEERAFYHWCMEARAYGIINGFVYQPRPFVLSDKVRRKSDLSDKKERSVLLEHIYTADFRLIRPMRGLFLSMDSNSVVIEVKGAKSRRGDHRAFSINRKWVYEKFGIIVYKIIPEQFFHLTWVPGVEIYTKTGKVQKKYEGVPLVTEFLFNKVVDNMCRVAYIK